MTPGVAGGKVTPGGSVAGGKVTPGNLALFSFAFFRLEWADLVD